MSRKMSDGLQFRRFSGTNSPKLNCKTAEIALQIGLYRFSEPVVSHAGQQPS